MINCNPETVSTDPDTSDRLYFESLTAEDVLEICRVEGIRGELLGVIVQLGGQTPLKLCHALERAGVPILGTSPDAIDLAEDRERFQQLLHRLGLKQPDNAICEAGRTRSRRRVRWDFRWSSGRPTCSAGARCESSTASTRCAPSWPTPRVLRTSARS